MARTWLGIRVDLIGGRGEVLWPRPGRIFAAARTHTFDQLAGAINDAFARWDLAHLNEFVLADGTSIGNTDPRLDPPEGMVDARKAKLSRLDPGEQFAYVFDFGDDWQHLCTVLPERVDPLESLGEVTTRPTAFWGWGTMPDQYGRRWDGDNDERPMPPDPEGTDLPPILPGWRRRSMPRT